MYPAIYVGLGKNLRTGGDRTTSRARTPGSGRRRGNASLGRADGTLERLKEQGIEPAAYLFRLRRGKAPEALLNGSRGPVTRWAWEMGASSLRPV